MSTIVDVLKINPHCFQANGLLKPFSQQYGEYQLIKQDYDECVRTGKEVPSDSTTAAFTPFVLSVSCASFGVPEIADRPLVISNASFDYIRRSHVGEASKLIRHLDNLAMEISESVIAFDSKRKADHIQFVLSEKTTSGNPVNVVVAVNLNQKTVDVASVRTMYGNSHLVEDMEKSLELGRRFYVNERTGVWLENLTAMGIMDPAGVLGRHLSYLYDTQFPNSSLASLNERPGANLESQRTLDRKGFPIHSVDVQKRPAHHHDTACENEPLADQAQAAIGAASRPEEPSPTKDKCR